MPHYREAPPVLSEFLSYMKNIRGKSPKTVDEYYLDLRTFFRFIKWFRGLVPDDIEFSDISIADVDLKLIETITLADVYEYLSYANEDRHNIATTRSRKVSSLRTFFKYLTTKTNQLKVNPVMNLETPKLKKTLPKHLTVEESVRLMENVDGQYQVRNYCILVLFLNCGLRLSELVGLNVHDIKGNTMRVTGKGNKEREIYLNDACIAALDDYLKERNQLHIRGEDSDALFVSRLNRRISPKTIQWIIKETLQKAGLGHQGYSTHKLRHTAATLMYQHGHVDIRVLKDLLGHENLSTTQIYTHVSDDQLKEAVNANPLASVRPSEKKKADSEEE